MLAQSAWTRNKGGVYAKLGVYTLSGANSYDTKGVKTVGSTFHQQAITFYGEYGINKNLTAILNFPILKSQYYRDDKAATGVGNPQIELKFALFKKIQIGRAHV